MSSKQTASRIGVVSGLTATLSDGEKYCLRYTVIPFSIKRLYKRDVANIPYVSLITKSEVTVTLRLFRMSAMAVT